MTKDDFLNELSEIMQLESPIKDTEILTIYTEWDSMTKLSVMSLFDMEFGISLSVDQIKTIETVSELIELAADQIKG